MVKMKNRTETTIDILPTKPPDVIALTETTFTLLIANLRKTFVITP